MKAIPTINTNILKTMKSLKYFLKMALSLLLNLFDPLLTLFSYLNIPLTQATRQTTFTNNNQRHFSAKSRPSKPLFLLSASPGTALRSARFLCKLTAMRPVKPLFNSLCEITPSSLPPYPCNLHHGPLSSLRLCGISFQSPVRNLNQATGPPTSSHHSSPLPIRPIRLIRPLPN